MNNRWCFTINNPGEYRPVFRPEHMAYLVYQIERGSEAGTQHLQGYVRFHNRKRLSTVKNVLENQGAHLEQARGSEEQNKAYCTKEDTRESGPFEFGVYDKDAGKQGNRSDLAEIAMMARRGAALQEIADAHPGDYIRYHAGIQALHLLIAPPPPVGRDVTVTVLWGPTGTGKTHRVLNRWETCYMVDAGRDPWGNYNREATICFDEFDFTRWTIQQMNKYLDKWRCLLDARYHNRFAAWTHVVICANSCPADWWPNEPHLLRLSFFRRIARSCHNVTDREMDVWDPESALNPIFDDSGVLTHFVQN